MRQARTWSERLVEARNAVEHEGWKLPSAIYRRIDSGISVAEPEISGQPVTEFAKLMIDRLCCFVEEVTMHCLQRRMLAQVTLSEIPIAERNAEAPERFVLTIGVGGLPRWNIAYHVSTFDSA